MTEEPWYALRVKCRHEKSVSANLQYKCIPELLPLYVSRNKWADRYKQVKVPLFPGYVFSSFSPGEKSSVLRTPGVIDIVRFGDVLISVDPKEIEALQRLMTSGLPSEPHPHLTVGERVEIRGGPFFGLTGLVAEVRNSLRLVLSVTLLHRSVLVELDRDWVLSSRDATKPNPVQDGRPDPLVEGISSLSRSPA